MEAERGGSGRRAASGPGAACFCAHPLCCCLSGFQLVPQGEECGLCNEVWCGIKPFSVRSPLAPGTAGEAPAQQSSWITGVAGEGVEGRGGAEQAGPLPGHTGTGQAKQPGREEEEEEAPGGTARPPLGHQAH